MHKQSFVAVVFHMEQDKALVLSLRALAWVASDSTRFGLFLAESGIGPADLRQAAGDPAFLAGVLDHVLANEQLLLAFCQAENIPPTMPAEARNLLPGAVPHD
jgi:hypothetical protein